MTRKPRPAITPPGTPEPNRTDLLGPRAGGNQPLTAPAGRQAYGSKTAEVDYQRAAPMQNQPGPGLTQDPVAALRAAAPPRIVPLTAPSERPSEPLTAGLATGPGPGPEVLGMQAQRTRVADVFANLANASNDSVWADLATLARNNGQ